MKNLAENIHRLLYRDGRVYWAVSGHGPPKKGSRAGSISPVHGYRSITLSGSSYYEHRIVYFMHNGCLPQNIDHINGDRSDNRIENLRKATQRQNCQNQIIPKNNKSGHKNVAWNKKEGRWSVRICIDGVRKFFGYYDDVEFAGLVATSIREKYHGEFACHGVR
jgi:hypothetical protein